jgi:uncharacterized protein
VGKGRAVSLFSPAAALGLSLAAASAGAITQAKLADPRPGSAVVDTTRTLGAADVLAIDALAGRARAGGELVVVVIDSVSGAVPRVFTTQLFHRWGLDGRLRNRGVMLLVALTDRKAEIVVGDGYPGTVTRVTDRIMRDVLVARFKAGRPRDAIMEGAQAIVEQVILPGQAALPSPRPPTRPVAAAINRAPAAAPPGSLLDRLTAGAIDNPLPAGGAIGGLVAGGALLRRYVRNRPRRCKACGTMMTRLDETADDAHLTSAEKVEEQVGSVDYDVWSCRCGQTLKLRYGTLFTSYGRCKRCQAKTLKVTKTTVANATTSSEGRARVDECCAICGFSRSYERRIPRDRPSSSRGSSSGRGSSGSW